MRFNESDRGRLWLVVLSAGAVLTAAGCGKKSAVGKVFPVSGKVLLGHDPLPSGVVVFAPDSSKGNSAKAFPVGTIGADGTYTLTTDAKKGAPLGWYTVTISTDVPPSGDVTKVPPRVVTINQKYKDTATSGLVYEVKESPQPGEYDIKVTK